MNQSIHLTILATIITGTLTLVTNTARANLSSASLVAVEFGLADDPVPNSSIGGGVRGQVQFALPGGATPNSSLGGGVRGDLFFAPPEDEAQPHSSVGGSVRGNVEFGLPGSATPNNSLGGGVRGDLSFAPPDDERQPNSSVGGSVRGDFEFGLPGDATPDRSIGGGVRGDSFFTPPEDEKQPDRTFGAGSRGDVQMVLPPGSATPGSTIAGGVRGEIAPLTALVPPTKHGRTVSARPTIYAYLPPIGAKTVFFSLQDEAGNPHYHTTLEVTGDGGVLSITLPETAAALELGKNYLWYFAPIEAGGILRPDNYAVTGWVKRVEPTVHQSKLSEESPLNLATEYARAGIWYDTLKMLVEAQRSEPENQNLAQEWHDLLEQIGLEAIASEPIYLMN